MENMGVIFRRLCDEEVEDQCFELMLTSLSGGDPHLKVTFSSIFSYEVHNWAKG